MSGILLIGQLPTISAENQSPKPEKWALFDLDWTLIRPKKGILHQIGVDWEWLPNRLERLKDFVREGFTIGIVTNQKPWPKNPLPDIGFRLNIVSGQLKSVLGVDVPIMAGLTNPEYRKPGGGWFKHLSPLPGSLMVGDAAGRPEDYNNADIGFAQAGKIDFYTPEQVFRNNTIPDQVYQMKPVVLILMGAPGSGKSQFAQQLAMNGWTHISSDQLGSNLNRILSEYGKALARGDQIVIDATNPTRERRLQYRNLATQHGIPSAIVHFVNYGEGRNKLRSNPVPKVVYNTYWKRFQPPDSNLEGTIYQHE